MTLAAATACLVCANPGGHSALLGGLLRRCGRCSFTWTVDELAPPAELYDANYYQGDGYEDYFLPRPRTFEAGRRLRWLLGATRPASLVEAGCAGGFFVAAARAAGIDATGVEVSPTAVRYAREELRVPVEQGCFEDVRLPGPVGAVCGFHVLEHVADPRLFLRAARDALEPGGWLFVEVPNVAASAARRLGAAWPGLQLRHHRWHFTPPSLNRLVADEGFTVVRQDTVPFRYYMPARYRWRHARRHLPADLLDLRTPRLSHPTRADLLRLVARRGDRVRAPEPMVG